MASGSYLTPRLYDNLKWIAQIALPAFGTLYFALASLWNLPKADEVVGTIVAVDAFLGVLLGLSSASYNASPASHQGTLDVVQSDSGESFAFKLRDHPADILDQGKKNVVFKVRKFEEGDEIPDLPPVDMPPQG